MDVYDVFQLSGGVILLFGYIPQIFKLIESKSSRDLSLKTFSMIFLGLVLMEIYAFSLLLKGTGQMYFITNSVDMILGGVLVFLIKYYRR